MESILMMVSSNYHAERVGWVVLPMVVLSVVHSVLLDHSSLRSHTHKMLLAIELPRSSPETHLLDQEASGAANARNWQEYPDRATIALPLPELVARCQRPQETIRRDCREW